VEGSITFSQLGQLIIFVVLMVAGGYAIMTLRNVNAAVKDVGAILKGNREALDQLIPNIATASENVVAITGDLRTGLGDTSKAVETADQITMYATVIGETVKAVASLFASTRKL
jgi:hypothetical protein